MTGRMKLNRDLTEADLSDMERNDSCSQSSSSDGEYDADEAERCDEETCELTIEDDPQANPLLSQDIFSAPFGNYDEEDEGEFDESASDDQQVTMVATAEDIDTRYSGESLSGILVPVNESQSIDPSLEAKRRKKRKNYTICLTNCKYDVVRDCARRLGLREVDEEDDWHVFWTDTSVSMDRVCSMRKYQKINHFPGMSEICRKDCLARNLGRMRRLFPKDFNISPRTWVLPADYADLQAYARTRRHRTYILKPDAGCQGKGIWFTRSAKDVKPTDNQVCQLYVSRPFLIDGFKFDLRVYVLVAGCDPFRIFVFKDGLARFTTVKYKDPATANLDNVYMHLTNYAVQKNRHEFVRDDEEAGTKRRISTINRWLASNGHDVAKLWSDIDDVIIKTILSAHGVLRHNYRSCFPEHSQGSACFEILGFDIILDRNLRPIVLEVNHSPSFSTDSQLDQDIKTALIWDTLRLVNIGAVDKRKALEEERRKARERLFQRGNKREAREDSEREAAKFTEQQRRHEQAHLGNYRRVYPADGTQERYDRYLTQAGSIYHETAAARARADCARQLRRDLERKWAEERELAGRQLPQQQQQQQQAGPAGRGGGYYRRGGRQLQQPPRPESPLETPAATDRRQTAKAALSSRRSQQQQQQQQPQQRPLRMTKRTATSYSLASREAARERTEAELLLAADTSRPQPIVDEEEIERLSGLLQRDGLVRSTGVTELVYRMLHCTPGTMALAPPVGAGGGVGVGASGGGGGGSGLPVLAAALRRSQSHRAAAGGGAPVQQVTLTTGSLRSSTSHQHHHHHHHRHQQHGQQQQTLMQQQVQRQQTMPEMKQQQLQKQPPPPQTAVWGRIGVGPSNRVATSSQQQQLPQLTIATRLPTLVSDGPGATQQPLLRGSAAAAAPLSVVSASAPVAARSATADAGVAGVGGGGSHAGGHRRLRAAGQQMERQETALLMR